MEEMEKRTWYLHAPGGPQTEQNPGDYADRATGTRGARTNHEQVPEIWKDDCIVMM